MIKGTYLLLITLISGLLAENLCAQAGNDSEPMTYDESIFIIANYSGVDALTPEKRTLSELLNLEVDGFRFLVQLDENTKELSIKNPDASTTPLIGVLKKINDKLETDTAKILTLFLDFDFDASLLETPFIDAGLNQSIYSYKEDEDWPSIQTMRESGQRLVVFSMQEPLDGPSWLHYIWSYAIEPVDLSSVEIVHKDISWDRDPQKRLLFFKGFSSHDILEMHEDVTSYMTQNPYFIELIKNVWRSAGKTPNFILVDNFETSIVYNINTLRSFPSVKGLVTSDNGILNYVNWRGMNNLTSGRFSFILEPGEKITLSPVSPGYKIRPQSQTIDESFNDKRIHFRASPLHINEDLEAYYDFEKNAKDKSKNRNNGKPRNITYLNDPENGWIASFNENSIIALPLAKTFGIIDHDFTVSVRLLIPKYLEGITDYCILSSKTVSYQRGLHYVIRNQRPYMGFFNDDLAGTTQIREGEWYHIVWRYDELSNEQAIYVNGVLDASALGRPSYKGSDSLFIGAYYNSSYSFMGEMDDLSIWSRALSDEEILKLSNKTIHIEPNIRYLLGSSYLVYIVLLITVLLLAALFLLRGRSGHRKRNKGDQVREDVMQARPHNNFIGIFGDFRIIDNHGNNIAGQLSPKLKQLFLVLLIFSLKEKNGISTRELSNILWKGQSLKSTKNLRGVTIRNLRKVLETVDRIDIQYQSDNWSLQLGGSVVCDYYVFLKLLENKNIHDYIIFSRFYDLIREGEFLKGESQPWMDEVKGYVGNSIMDVLLQHLQDNSKSLDPGDILTIADLILVYDPVNEVALSYKMKTLVMQNNHNLARFTYKQFCQMYQDMYGEAFNRSFEQMIS